jgi:(p)ppGpp synthase/HD superfamily hydrolase
MKNYEAELLCLAKYNEAMVFAIDAHKNQMYGERPYIIHLIQVSKVLSRFGFHAIDSERGVVLHCAALLHDTIEDAGIKYKDIEKAFGKAVAEIVYAVTDEIGRNRKERHEKTYPKIRANRDAIVVKLSDRIANVEFSSDTRSRQMDMYRHEFKEFRSALFNGENLEMWEHLEKILNPTGEKK